MLMRQDSCTPTDSVLVHESKLGLSTLQASAVYVVLASFCGHVCQDGSIGDL